MELRPPAVRELLEQLEQLPGVGPRTATRLVHHLVRLPEGSRRLAAALGRATDAVRHCSTCYLLTEEDPCAVCRDETRDRSVICVVEDPLNAWAIEATSEFRGVYHVLGGTLDPLHGIGPEELTIAGLVERVPAPDDGRGILVRLTSDGMAVHYAVVARRREMLETSVRAVSVSGDIGPSLRAIATALEALV